MKFVQGILCSTLLYRIGGEDIQNKVWALAPYGKIVEYRRRWTDSIYVVQCTP